MPTCVDLHGWTRIHTWSICVCVCVYQQHIPSLAAASTWVAGGVAASPRACRFIPAPAVQSEDILSTTTLFVAPHQGANKCSNREAKIGTFPMTRAKRKKPENQYLPDININTSLQTFQPQMLKFLFQLKVTTYIHSLCH